MEQHPDVVLMVGRKMEIGEGRLSTILKIPEAPTLAFLLSFTAQIFWIEWGSHSVVISLTLYTSSPESSPN